MSNIVLIGFMGVGKGTVARAMFKNHQRMTIDTDDLIESMENRKIKEIFEVEGEEYFRELEKKVAKWLQKSVKNSIISTGGGFYKVKNLNKIGSIILLDSPFESIYQRILNHPEAEKKLAKRPLFSSPQKAKELYERRVAEYKKVATHIVDVTDKDEKDVAKEILELFN
jgi:shikimate kinase